MTKSLLEIRDLDVAFRNGESRVSAVSGVSLSVHEGESLAIVGESGCGKSTLATAVMGLLPASATVDGRILFDDRDLTELDDAEMRSIRGNRISMVFQDPKSSLDPTFGIGMQVSEAIRAHQRISRAAAKEKALSLLNEVGIPDAEHRYDDPPHRFSGGMRQRVVIAAALANDPALVLADEATTALDVTIQAQILALLDDLRRKHSSTIVFITHDLGVVAQVCDRVGVMYAGQLVELAPVSEIFRAPQHPYTRALLEALATGDHEPGALRVIQGDVPNLTDPPPGCRFAPRCSERTDACDQLPPEVRATPDHRVSCWLHVGEQSLESDGIVAGEGH